MSEDNLGIADALVEGLKIGVAKDRNRIANNRTQNQYSVQLANLRRQQQQLEFQKQKEDFDIANKLLDDISIKYDGKPQEQAMFFTSDQGKEVLKYFKKTMPNQFDDNGKLITRSTKDVVQAKLEGVKESLLQKQNSGVPLLPHEQRTLDFFETGNVDTNLFAKAVDTVSKSEGFKDMTPQAQASTVLDTYKTYANAYASRYSNSLGGQDQNDPVVRTGTNAQGERVGQTKSGKIVKL